jgi:hypothetical protein
MTARITTTLIPAVILIPQSREKDLAHKAWDMEKRDPTSYERFLALLGMTSKK